MTNVKIVLKLFLRKAQRELFILVFLSFLAGKSFMKVLVYFLIFEIWTWTAFEIFAVTTMAK